MLLDVRVKKVPPGYAGHIPCRNEVFGLSEGRALQLSMDTYELFKDVKQQKSRQAYVENKTNSAATYHGS